MKSLSAGVLVGLLWLGLNASASAAEEGIDFRKNEEEILFLNPAVHREGGFHLWSRRNLTLRLSQDEGRTWPHARVLNEGLAGYSDLAVTKEGKILCAFENGTNDYCEKISIVQIDRAWLVAGKEAQQANEPGEK